MSSKAYRASHLIALENDVEQREYTLRDDSYTIGRLPGMCEIVVNRKSVSRLHAKIERKGSYYILHNLSRQNTYVNGTPITGEQILYHRDTIGLDSPSPTFRFIDENQTVLANDEQVAEEAPHRLRYDKQTMMFYLNDKPVELTPQQLRLLHYLYRHAGQVCTRESCEQAIWGEHPVVDTSSLHRVISDLRARLRDLDDSAEFIETRRGIGYILHI